MPNMKYTLFRNRRGRRGISTVLGMLIFIGVLFTSVIPLFLYVNKVNSIYDQSVHEMSDLDLERTQEKCDVFAYPQGPTSDLFNVYIKNKCALDIKIERVWVNNICYNFSDAIVPAMGDYTIIGINVSQLKDTSVALLTKVTSARGKSYSSLTNPLIWDGTWVERTTFNIQVVIESTIKGSKRYEVKVIGENLTIVKTERKNPGEDSVTVPFWVSNEGNYTITVENISSNPPLMLNPIPSQIEINFSTNLKVWVYCYDT